MYRVYTEDVNRARIEAVANDVFPAGFTLIPAVGFYMGQAEQSLIIEIDGSTWEQVNQLAVRLCNENSQNEVLVQNVATDLTIIKANEADPFAESRCAVCNSPFGHYAVCPRLNPDTRDAHNVASGNASDSDRIIAHGMGVTL